MNVEELREIAEALLDHAQETDAVTGLEQLKEALDRQINNPQDAAAQTAVAEARQGLADSLRAGVADEFNARWRSLAVEMGIGFLLPDEMLSQLDELFVQNQVTLQVVNEGVASLANDVTSAVNKLTSLVESLEFLNLESSGLLPGEFEAAIVIPRAEVDNSLGGLGRELQKLEELLRPFIESDVGSPPPIAVRQIASSEFLAAVLLTPGAAILLSKAIVGVLDVYERVLRIRKLRQELFEVGLTQSTIDNVEQDATDLVDREIPTIVRNVLEEASTLSDDGRQYEVEAALTSSVRGIARRIDHGFRMSVRTGPSPESENEDDGDSEAQDPEVAAARDLVIENQRRTEAQELAGDPILRELGVGEKQEGEDSDSGER